MKTETIADSARAPEMFSDAVPLFRDVAAADRKTRRVTRRAAERYLTGTVGCETVEGYLAADLRIRETFGAESGTRKDRDALKTKRADGTASDADLRKLDAMEAAYGVLNLAGTYKSTVGLVAVRATGIEPEDGKPNVSILADLDAADWAKVTQALTAAGSMDRALRYGRYGGTPENPASKPTATKPPVAESPEDAVADLPEDLAAAVTEILDAVEAALDAKAREATAGILTFHAERIRRAAAAAETETETE